MISPSQGSTPAPMSGRNDGWCCACLDFVHVARFRFGRRRIKAMVLDTSREPPGFHNAFLLQESGVKQMGPNIWDNDKG